MAEIEKDQKQDLKEAMNYWSTHLKKVLEDRFGKKRLGHVIIVFPFGEATNCSWISDANGEGVAMLLHHLADHIENPHLKIIKTH